jgi:hypothetical protein
MPQGEKSVGDALNLTSKTLADGLEDGVVLNVISVVGLELRGDTGQGALESLLGGGVDHLGLDTGIIWGPGDKGNLVAETIARGEAVLEVVDGVTGALANSAGAGLGGGVDELLTEVVPVLVLRSLLNDNLLEVIRELVDDVLVLLVQLELIVGSDALLRDGGTKQTRIICIS